MLSFDSFWFGVGVNSFSKEKSLFNKLRPQIIEAALVKMLKFLFIN